MTDDEWDRAFEAVIEWELRLARGDKIDAMEIAQEYGVEQPIFDEVLGEFIQHYTRGA